MGAHLVSVQETRLTKAAPCKTEHYFVVSHPATSRGHGGIQLWIHRSLKFCSQLQPFAFSDIKLAHAATNLLIVKLRCGPTTLLIVAVHAPHSGYAPDQVHQFWANLQDAIDVHGSGLPIIFAGDANSHVGSVTSNAVSDCGAEPQNVPGAAFHQWLLHNQMWLPSTFPSVHRGQHVTSWTPDGMHAHRNDFVALPNRLLVAGVQSHICTDLDLSMHRTDHLAACVEFSVTLVGTPVAAVEPSRLQGDFVRTLCASPQHRASIRHAVAACSICPRCSFILSAATFRIVSTCPATSQKALATGNSAVAAAESPGV
eukprot:Skav212093  [mRNA]  locus=scaffold4509:73684:74625:+ [translate_table: standard]